MSMQTPKERVGAVSDPRFQYGYLRHNLEAILSAAFCAVICVAEDYEDIKEFGRARRGAYHVVSAWVGEIRITLGEIAADEKSNEITVIPKLLDLVDVSGSTVTIDAIGCQKEIAKKITE